METFKCLKIQKGQIISAKPLKNWIKKIALSGCIVLNKSPHRCHDFFHSCGERRDLMMSISTMTCLTSPNNNTDRLSGLRISHMALYGDFQMPENRKRSDYQCETPKNFITGRPFSKVVGGNVR